MGDLDKDTRVEGADGRYTAQICRDWEIWGPNGGYMAVIALRAAGAEAAIPRPVSFTGHFIRPARFEEVQIDVEVVQRGRRAESIRVRIRQGDRNILEALVRTGLEVPGLEHVDYESPDVPGPEGLATMDELWKDEDRGYPKFWSNIESRPLRDWLPMEQRKAEPPRTRDWFRFRPRATFDDPFVDAGRSLLLVDTMLWPAAFQHHLYGGYIAPSLDVTAWFHRQSPTSPWLFCDAHSPLGEGGLVAGHSRIYDLDRRLVASGGGQLMCVPGPE